MNLYEEYLDTPIGRFCIQADPVGVTAVRPIGENKEEARKITEPVDERAKAMVRQACEELLAYFAGRRTTFDVPVHLQGTPFQEAVWCALREIPYGETRSYKQIAEQIGNPKSARAVGMANNKNKILILVPCHRVIGSNGNMVGFACGLEMKTYLLELEQK